MAYAVPERSLMPRGRSVTTADAAITRAARPSGVDRAAADSMPKATSPTARSWIEGNGEAAGTILSAAAGRNAIATSAVEFVSARRNNRTVDVARITYPARTHPDGHVVT